MNFEIFQGRRQQIHGRLLEWLGLVRSDSQIWIKGRHVRINGMLMVCQSKARLALAHAGTRQPR